MPARNTYWTAPGATGYIEVALFPSNTYLGVSRLYGSLYRQITLTRNDTVADLIGGRFLVRDGQAHRLRFTAEVRHPFERGGPTPDPLPATARQVPAIPFPGRTKVEVIDSIAPYVPFGALDALDTRDPS